MAVPFSRILVQLLSMPMGIDYVVIGCDMEE